LVPYRRLTAPQHPRARHARPIFFFRRLGGIRPIIFLKSGGIRGCGRCVTYPAPLVPYPRLALTRPRFRRSTASACVAGAVTRADALLTLLTLGHARIGYAIV